MWFKIAASYDVAVIDRKLINYRVHENQGSELELRVNIEIPDVVTVIRAYHEQILDKKIRTLSARFVDKRILMAALKQNRQRQFSRSSETVKMTETGSYLIIKTLLLMANRLHFKLKL
jgi:hypothetical protein